MFDVVIDVFLPELFKLLSWYIPILLVFLIIADMIRRSK